MLCGKGNQDKLGKINERALRLAYSEYSSSYKELLANSKETTIPVKSVRILALEVNKTLNNLNPVFVKDYFVPKTTGHNLRLKNPLDILQAKACCPYSTATRGKAKEKATY